MKKNEGNEVLLLPGRWTWKRSPNLLLNMLMENEVVAMLSTNSEGERIHDNFAKFDSNSAKVGIDNRYSTYISHDINVLKDQLSK